MSLAAEASRLYLEGQRGVARARALPEALRRQEPGWALVLDAQRHAADPALASAPRLEAVAALGPAHAGVVWRAAIELAKNALLAFDPAELARATRLAAELVARAEDGRGALWVRALERWVALARGQASGDAGLGAAARAAGDASLVVEATALDALAAAAAGELDVALECARRASRMARTEALPQAEYLAHLVLARLRRLRGYPHLAGRILDALARLASPRWQRWLAWERGWAGTVELPGGLAAARAAARAGDRAAYGAATEALYDHVRDFAPVALEARCFVAACDPDAAPPPQLAPWCAGADARAPLGLYAPDDHGSLGYVACRPESRGRRILPPGQGLFGAPLLPRQRRKQSRVESLVSVLALAGPEGVHEADAFRTVYGFAFVPELHRGTFDVAQHRARAYLGARGSLERRGGDVRLVLTEPVLVPDPRCAEPLENRLLRAVAGGAGSAKAAADAAGVSLRQAQKVLQELARDGACVAAREGRQVAYRVEDTTFSEPTRH